MTLSEAAAALGYSEVTLKANFNKTKERLAKKGIILIKTGWGDKAQYYIKIDGELLD